MARYNSMITLGDSFTEGMSDLLPDGSYLGWADRLAVMMAEENPAFHYANLALRGKTILEIVEEQLPVALHIKPDLVTICAGGNDLVVPGADIDRIAAHFDDMVRQLVEAGIPVLVFTGPDMREVSVVNMIRRKVGTYNAHLHGIAARYGTLLVDLWSMDAIKDPRAFCEDRLHLSPEGHRRVALRVAEVLGIETDADWREPWPEFERSTWLDLRRSDITWARAHLLPWVARLLRGESTGDGLAPKRPRLEPFVPAQQSLNGNGNGNGHGASTAAPGAVAGSVD